MTTPDQNKVITGVMCERPDNRSITCFPAGENLYAVTFKNKDIEHRIKFSGEAIQALHHLWTELRNRGLAA